MQIRNIAHASLRLLVAPITGAVEGVKEAIHRPRTKNWQQFILNDIRAYFAPLTGAINGVRKELTRSGTRAQK